MDPLSRAPDRDTISIGDFFSGSPFCSWWWIGQSGVCFPNQEAYLPACKKPKTGRQQECIVSFLNSLSCLKKEHSLYLIWGFQNVPFNIYLNNLCFYHTCILSSPLYFQQPCPSAAYCYRHTRVIQVARYEVSKFKQNQFHRFWVVEISWLQEAWGLHCWFCCQWWHGARKERGSSQRTWNHTYLLITNVQIFVLFWWGIL